MICKECGFTSEREVHRACINHSMKFTQKLKENKILIGNKRNYKSFDIVLLFLRPEWIYWVTGNPIFASHRESIFASHRECVLHNQDEIGFDLLTCYYVNPHQEKTLKLNDHYYPCGQGGTSQPLFKCVEVGKIIGSGHNQLDLIKLGA